MVPTSCKIIDEQFMKKVISAMYGTQTDDWLSPNWASGPTLPCSFMNLPMQFPAHYCMFANNAQNKGNIGWQNITQHITKMDASTAVGTTIIDYSYKPILSYLTMPWLSVYSGRTETDGLNTESFKVTDTNSIALPNSFTINNIDGTYKADASNNYALLTEEFKKLY
ncbi:unnamed protein product [Macrosiphum euphorbiae]|uniref:Uncharacterized protein n=1 Tax=Macrosiphum euphorbiae TaxID=13131 RepID=A0AAV0Y6L4_9HEMI|nr:unnamed protein product [Macrosiphum euphorbiae]